MKNFFIILLIFVGINTIAVAQQKTPTAVELATKSMEKMEKRLKLNSTQRSVIYNYTLDMSREQLAMVKKQQAGTYNEDDISKFYKLQNETNQSIRNILKGDQQTEYDKFMEEQLNSNGKKKKKGKKGKNDKEEEEVVTGISGLKLPPTP
jgi:protein CpxP